MTGIMCVQARHPLALPSLLRVYSSRSRSLAPNWQLRRTADISIARQLSCWARAPGLEINTAPSNDTNDQEFGRFEERAWTGVVSTCRDHLAGHIPQPNFFRAAIFCLGALVAFVLAGVVRKLLILLTLRLGRANPSQAVQHDLNAQDPRSAGRQSEREQNESINLAHAQSLQGQLKVTRANENRETEFQDMADVMQQAAQKVAVMQQVVDTAKLRLKEEIQLTSSLQEESSTLKRKISCLSEEKQEYEHQLAVLEEQFQTSRTSDASSVETEVTFRVGVHQQAGHSEQAMQALLVTAQSEKDQLATILSASEERSAKLQSELAATQELASESERLAQELRERTNAAEAENALLAQQVEELTSQQASGHHQSAERDEDVKALQQQLALMRQQMDSSNSALEALEAASQDQATQAECKVGGLETDLENVRTEKLLADQATQQAVKKLSEYERDIVKCVSSILEGKGDNTGMPSYATTEAWWGLPDSQLAEFLQIQQARLMEARLQKEAIWKKLPAKAKREADKLQQDVEDACQQISRGVNDEESSASVVLHQKAEGKMLDFLQRHLSVDHLATFQALMSECVELEQRSEELRNAMDLSLAERMLQLLAQQMGTLKEAADRQSTQTQKAMDAEERESLRALADDLTNRQTQIEQHQTQLLQRQKELKAEAAAAKERVEYVKELSAQAQKKAEALAAKEQKLVEYEETLKEREARIAAQAQRLDAQIQREEAAEEGTLTGVDAIEAEANQLKVESLQEELASLKEMYSRQFVASKKELDAAQNRIRQLRREILRPHNGVQPRSDGVAEPETGGASDPSAKPHGTVPDSDVSLWASELITKVSRSPPEDVAAANGAKPSAVNVAERKTARMAQVSTSTLERGEVATESEEVQQRVKKLRLEAVGVCVPHPAKVERGGEDAHFVLESSAIGVADGVGGWSKSGVDPGQYSKQLMQYTEQAIKGDSRKSCVQALEYAHDRVAVPGSCTAIVAKLRDDSTMEVANLGDSGLRVVRDGEIAFATDSLQHGFNMPFQLGNRTLIPYTDVPKSSLQSVVPVQPGDIVVMASDGFFDNVWDEDLAALVQDSCLAEEDGEEDCVATMAEQLVNVAARNSQDQMYRSPWSVQCAEKNDNVSLLRKLFPRGGKVDDITVVLARVGDC